MARRERHLTSCLMLLPPKTTAAADPDSVETHSYRVGAAPNGGDDWTAGERAEASRCGCPRGLSASFRYRVITAVLRRTNGEWMCRYQVRIRGGDRTGLKWHLSTGGGQVLRRPRHLS